MSHDHNTPENLDSKFKIGLILNTGFTIFEFLMGAFSGSLALISDASHNLTDSVSLLIAFLANKVSKRTANERKTYGYGRVTILAALVNTLILISLAFYIFHEAYLRLLSPTPVDGGIVMIVALVGIIINGTIAYTFFKNRDDLNTKAAFLSMAFDTLASIGALIAGLMIALTGKTFIDPLISMLIGVMLLISAYGVIKDALHILLDGVPTGIDVEKVKKSILAVDGVKGLDDLHVWALSTKVHALSCHLIIDECSLAESVDLVSTVKEMLHKDYAINHATIETELLQGPHDNEQTDEGL